MFIGAPEVLLKWMIMMMVYWKIAVSHGRRLFSCSAVVRVSVCKALVYDKLGQPEDVVK